MVHLSHYDEEIPEAITTHHHLNIPHKNKEIYSLLDKKKTCDH